jgi:hypothetical protein
VRLDDTGQLDSVNLGHHEVCQCHISLFAVHLLKHFRVISRDRQIVAESLQAKLYGAQQVILIVNQ